MAMLHVVVWKWSQPNFRETYTSDIVNIVARMVRNATQGLMMRVVCVTDDAYGIDSPTETYELWKDHDDLPNVSGKHLPSCYRRLRLFDYTTQKAMGFQDGDRVISLDLDAVIMAPLHELLNHIEQQKGIYTGWGVRGTYHQLVFNGSFWSFKVGPHLQNIWDNFDPKTSPRTAMSQGFLGSDQGWMSLQFAKRKDVCAVRYPEFASYPREVRRSGILDRRTKIIFFHGSRKPWHRIEQNAQPWIIRHWR